MHRIIVSFFDEQAAIRVRQAIDGTAFSGTSIAKCYFGEPTPIAAETKYLERPDAGRLFFISPPPSPPVGWEMRAEDPPNKHVHAEDLASKLSKLTGRLADADSSPPSSSPVDDSRLQYTADELATRLKAAPQQTQTPRSPVVGAGGSPKKVRSRSSTLIYDPKVHGDSPALPAVMLETEDDSDVELDDQPPPKKILAHTSRPPLELMEH